MKIRTFVTILMFVLMALGSNGETIDTSKVKFESPMTIVNRAEADRVRQRIREGLQPQASAYKALIDNANAALTFIPDPPSSMNIMGGYQKNSNLSEMRAIMERESMAAYSSALAWLYSGEARYADKAAEVLRAWAVKGTRMGGHDAGLQIGSWFNGMLYAADILKSYEGWTQSDRKQFEEWWREQALPHKRKVMREARNNWQDAALLGVLTAAVVFEDRNLLNEGLLTLDSYFRARGRNADWKFRKDARGVYIPAEVGRNNGRSGIIYTAYALTTMVQAMEIARYCGYDFWHREAENGATMKELIEYLFRWNDLGEEFPWSSNPVRRNDPSGTHWRKNPHELANNYFPGEIQGLKEWLKEHRPVDGRQGDPYITLNRGDLGSDSRKSRK